MYVDRSIREKWLLRGSRVREKTSVNGSGHRHVSNVRPTRPISKTCPPRGEGNQPLARRRRMRSLKTPWNDNFNCISTMGFATTIRDWPLITTGFNTIPREHLKCFPKLLRCLLFASYQVPREFAFFGLTKRFLARLDGRVFLCFSLRLLLRRTASPSACVVADSELLDRFLSGLSTFASRWSVEKRVTCVEKLWVGCSGDGRKSLRVLASLGFCWARRSTFAPYLSPAPR